MAKLTITFENGEIKKELLFEGETFDYTMKPSGYGMKGDKSPVAKKVKCVNTGEIFNSIREAGDFCNMKHPSNISECCKGKRKTAGKHPVTGEKLIWEYLMP